MSTLERPSFWNYRQNQKKRVAFGSPAANVLQRGDIITKVGNYDARDIRHQDAQHLFKNAGTNVKVVVQRENPSRLNTSTASSRASSHNYSPLSLSPHLSPRGGNLNSPGYSPAGSALTPVYTAPFTPLDDNYFYVPGIDQGGRTNDPNVDVHVTKQVANSVLERISSGDPNKQIIHKQFNSPIGLYSDAAIADTVQKQTGLSPIRKPVKFNPAESEAYKAIQEEQYGEPVQEVTVPPKTKVYTPNKVPPASKVRVQRRNNQVVHKYYHCPLMALSQDVDQ